MIPETPNLDALLPPCVFTDAARAEISRLRSALSEARKENEALRAALEHFADCGCSCGPSLDSMSNRDPDCVECAAKEALRAE